MSRSAFLLAWALLCGFKPMLAPQSREAKQKPTHDSRQNADAVPEVGRSPASAKTSTDSSNQDSGGKQSDNYQKASIAAPEKSVDVVERVISIVGVICTVGLTVAGIVGVCAAIKTLKALRIQSVIMRRQTRHIARQARSMRYQTTHLKNSVIQATRAAKAAKLSADVSIGVAVPTLRVEEFRLGNGGIGTLEAKLQFPIPKIVVKNYGQTPAFFKAWTVVFTCEEIPLSPQWPNGLLLEKNIGPQESYEIPVNPVSRQEIPIEDAAAVAQGRKPFRAYGYILYGDIFESPLRRLKFCQIVINQWGSDVAWADDWTRPAYQGNEYLPRKDKKEGNTKPN